LQLAKEGERRGEEGCKEEAREGRREGVLGGWRGRNTRVSIFESTEDSAFVVPKTY
jgi:hypothetical protein